MADIEDDEPLFSLSVEDIAQMEVDRARIEFALTTHVSEEVRTECEAELAAAKKRGYKRV